MLKIEKIKEEILNYDTSDDFLECWLHQITTNSYDNKNSCSNSTCSECLRLSLMNLLEEYKKPVKLSKFEYEYLKFAKKEGFNFIARDKTNILYEFEKRPKKCDLMWGSGGDCVRMFKSTFSFVKWKDEEPWEIDEILNNCTIVSGDAR